MKSRTPFRAGALLLVLALVCSLMTLPVMADDTGLEVSFDQQTLTLTAGDTGKLTPTIKFGGNTVTDTSDLIMEWRIFSIIGDSIATIADDGRVTALRPGTCEIQVLVNTRNSATIPKSASYTLVVQAASIESITLPESIIQMQVGDTVYLRPTILPETTTNRSLRVDISDLDREIIEPLDSGYGIRAKKAGRATVTLTATDGSGKSASCTVYVSDVPISGMTINGSRELSLNLAAGDRVTLTAAVLPENVDQGIRWSQQDPNWPFTLTANGNQATITVKNNAQPTGTESGYTISATSTTDAQYYALCIVRIIGPRPSQVSNVQITSPNIDEFRYVDPGKSITLGAVASPADAPATDREIVWSSSNTSIATVNRTTGQITGVAPGKVTIFAAAAGDESIRASREIEVSGILLSYLKRSTTGGQGTTVNLTSSSIEDIFQYRNILVNTTTYGNAKGKAINWESTNNSVAQVINGWVTANYPGENVTISASVAGTGFSASFKVRVLEDVVEAIPVHMGSSSSYSFADLVSILNNRSLSKTGASLECVYNLKVSTKNGILYYKYVSANTPNHGVGGTEYYYYQATSLQMALREITFIPSPGFNGVAIIDYNARATNGSTFVGTIRIEAAATGDVAYSTEMDQTVTFSSEHFSAICQGRNNQAIRYITFDQPASSQGTLYQDYSPPGLYSSRVSSSTRYYVTSSPSIDQITFVPAAGYVGHVFITYHCVDSAGTSFTGTVSIQVGSGGSSSGSGSGSYGSNVVFSTAINQRLTLSVSDFNSASQRITGSSLNYIRFDSLPSTSVGRFYLNYVSSSGTGTQVTTGRNYYRNTTPRISNITFVPASGYSGTVTIPYTGTDVSGTSFSGRLIIYVGTSSSGTTVRQTMTASQSISLSPSAFNGACLNATGNTLSYIRFTSLPSSTYGTLTYQSATTVNTSTTYYYSGSIRPISGLIFTARGVSGTVTFGFTGYSTQGVSFSGTVQIEITGGTYINTGTGSLYYYTYTGCSAPISFSSLEFQSACQAALGTSLASVQFNTLPSMGRLYLNYSSPGQPGTLVASAARYGTQELDQITYLPRAEYQGTISIPYTGYDTQGGSFSGTVTIQLSNSYCRTFFSDLAGVSWAVPSIEFLRCTGITTGYGDGTFRPRQSISRGEFTLMICRAFQFSTTGSSGFPDVPSSSVYAGAVASARNLGIVQGDNGRFYPDQPISRQSAMAMISRAMTAAGRTLPEADPSILSSYQDANRVSQFARDAVSILIQTGAVRGTSDMRINPTNSISRAEMAVILHRVLTQ